MARVLICERPDTDLPVLDVALSERNAIALVSRLHVAGSRLSFVSYDVPRQFGYATFRIEPDDFHYQYPTRDGAPPAPLDPMSELVCAAVKETLRLFPNTEGAARRQARPVQ